MELGSPDLQVDSFISWATREGPSFLGTALKNKRKTTTTATTTTKPLITWLKEHLKPDLEDFLNKNSDAVPLRRQGNYVRFNEKENKNVNPRLTTALVTQSCPTLCDPMDYSPPGSSVHGVLQARILMWAVISFSKVNCRTFLKLFLSLQYFWLRMCEFSTWNNYLNSQQTPTGCATA